MITDGKLAYFSENVNKFNDWVVNYRQELLKQEDELYVRHDPRLYYALDSLEMVIESVNKDLKRLGSEYEPLHVISMNMAN